MCRLLPVTHPLMPLKSGQLNVENVSRLISVIEFLLKRRFVKYLPFIRWNATAFLRSRKPASTISLLHNIPKSLNILSHHLTLPHFFHFFILIAWDGKLHGFLDSREHREWTADERYQKPLSAFRFLLVIACLSLTAYFSGCAHGRLDQIRLWSPLQSSCCRQIAALQTARWKSKHGS